MYRNLMCKNFLSLHISVRDLKMCVPRAESSCMIGNCPPPKLQNKKNRAKLNRKCKTTTYQRSFFIRASRTWNSLPTTLRSPDINIRQFKTDLQTYYLTALRECFNEEDPRTWKTICLKCNTSRYLRSKLTCCF